MSTVDQVFNQEEIVHAENSSSFTKKNRKVPLVVDRLNRRKKKVEYKQQRRRQCPSILLVVVVVFYFLFLFSINAN